MTDQPIDRPKVASNPIEPEPVQRGRRRMTRGRKKAVALIVTIVGTWAAYTGHILLAGWLFFPMFGLWNWALWPEGISYRVSNPWDIEAIRKIVSDAKEERKGSR